MVPLSYPVLQFERLKVQLRKTEHLLEETLTAVRSIAEVLIAKFGEDSLPPHLQRLADTGLPAQIETVVQTIEELLATGREPAANRLIHDEMGLTWDEANAFTASWSGLSKDARSRSVRLALFSRALEKSDEPTT